MAKKDDKDAPVDSTAAQPTTPLVTDDAAAPTAPTTATTTGRGLSRLALGGIIGGSVLAALLLFGGGVAVGVALPDRAPFGIAQAGHPGGGPGMQEGHPGTQQLPYDGVRPKERD